MKLKIKIVSRKESLTYWVSIYIFEGRSSANSLSLSVYCVFDFLHQPWLLDKLQHIVDAHQKRSLLFHHFGLQELRDILYSCTSCKSLHPHGKVSKWGFSLATNHLSALLQKCPCLSAEGPLMNMLHYLSCRKF